MEFDIRRVLKELSDERSLFHNECDFQFALAWKIREIYGYTICLEYCYPELQWDGRQSYIDIVVSNESKNECILFELKYKTVASEQFDTKGERYTLKNHGARDYGCYSVLSDLARIEKQVGSQMPDGKIAVQAYSVLLTNDERYKTGFRSGALFEKFGLTDGKYFNAEKPIDFVLAPGKKQEDTCARNFKPITLQNTYKVQWEKYCNLHMLIFQVPV